MTRRCIGCVLAVGVLAGAIAGCQSGNSTSKAAAKSPSLTAPSATEWAGAPTPAEVTSVPTTAGSTPGPLLSKKWGHKLDAVAAGTAQCQDLHTSACAKAVAAAGTLGGNILSDIDVTDTRGRYVQARPQAQRMSGAAALYARFHCASKNSAARDDIYRQSVLDTLPGAIVLKAQLQGDERHAGLL